MPSRVTLMDQKKYRAKFVAKGYSQKLGSDYEETFSLSTNMTSVRVVIPRAAKENVILHQMDIRATCLHALPSWRARMTVRSSLFPVS